MALSVAPREPQPEVKPEVEPEVEPEGEAQSTAMLGTVDRSAGVRTVADVAVALLRRTPMAGIGGVGVGLLAVVGRGGGDGSGASRATNDAASACLARDMHSTQMPQRICCAPSADMSIVMRRSMRHERHTICRQQQPARAISGERDSGMRHACTQWVGLAADRGRTARQMTHRPSDLVLAPNGVLHWPMQSPCGDARLRDTEGQRQWLPLHHKD